MKQDKTIAAGIPSYNEEDSIANVVKQVDSGLLKYFPEDRAVIVNMDSCSTDRTREVFSGTRTASPRKTLLREGVRGKGNMLRMFFEFVLQSGAERAFIVDADLKSISPEWVRLLVGPLSRGYDYCAPLYSRHRNDGTITNLLVYPLVLGIYGADIRQPIGGEFAFSRKAVIRWLDREWRESTRFYGIDNFMTTTAVTAGLNICQVKLGSKVHKASAPKIGQMFIQVADTLFSGILDSPDFIRGVEEVKTPPVFGDAEAEAPEVVLDRNRVLEKARGGMEEFSRVYGEVLPGRLAKRTRSRICAGDWAEVVYRFLANFRNGRSHSLLEALSYLYFMRVHSFLDETEGLSEDEAESRIRQSAGIFFEKRGLLLEALKTKNGEL